MNISELLFMIIRYIVLGLIIFLLIKYFPNANISLTNTVFATIIIILITVLVEIFIKFIISNKSGSEYFVSKNQGSSCTQCSVENFSGSNSSDEGDIYEAGICQVKCNEKNDKNQCSITCDGPIQNISAEITNLTLKNQENGTSTSNGKNGTSTSNGSNETSTSNCKNSTSTTNVQVNKPTTSKDHDTKTLTTGSNNDSLKIQPGQCNQGIPPEMKKHIDSYFVDDFGVQGYDSSYGYGGMYYDQNPSFNLFNDTNKFTNIANTGSHKGGKQTQASDDDGITTYMNTSQKTDTNMFTTSGYESPYQETGSLSQKLVTTDNDRRIVGPLDDELPYSDHNHLPVATGYKSHDYEYGYSYIPPEKWFPQPIRPPICKTEKRSPVCPVLSDNSVADLKEWHDANRITGPYQLNEAYVSDKMNSGG